MSSIFRKGKTRCHRFSSRCSRNWIRPGKNWIWLNWPGCAKCPERLFSGISGNFTAARRSNIGIISWSFMRNTFWFIPPWGSRKFPIGWDFRINFISVSSSGPKPDALQAGSGCRCGIWKPLSAATMKSRKEQRSLWSRPGIWPETQPTAEKILITYDKYQNLESSGFSFVSRSKLSIFGFE